MSDAQISYIESKCKDIQNKMTFLRQGRATAALVGDRDMVADIEEYLDELAALLMDIRSLPLGVPAPEELIARITKLEG